MNTVSRWKERLDMAKSFGHADSVMHEAIMGASRDELLSFLSELYQEFIGPDSAGGGAHGTLERMRKIVKHIVPTDVELMAMSITPESLRAYLAHA